MELGRKIVHELDLEPGVDTLAKWMAHDLAEQIQKCEEVGDEGRERAFSECRETIHRLWDHLLNDPQRLPAFKDCDQLIRTLASFTEETPRYYANYHQINLKDNEPTESQKWLRIAEGVDYTAQSLIDYAISNAIEHAASKETVEWLNSAREAKALESGLGQAISIVFKDVGEEDQRNSKQREALSDRLKRLEAFTSIANELADDLRTKLAKLSEVD